MRTLALPAGKSPLEWGRIHGESFRGEISALAEIRLYLCTRVGGFKTREQVLAAARAHLPVLERYDRALYDELCGIAGGAAIDPALIVVANHYTDLRDLDPEPASWRPAPMRDTAEALVNPERGADSLGGDGCSVIYAESPTGKLLAQTWDMHATAIPYVMTLDIPDSPAGPAARLLTVTGCLGMAGMNGARVGIAINNLYSTDATLGVVWPAIVRKALQQRTAAGAREVIMHSPIGSGHHYLIADREAAFAIEASGTRRKIIFTGGPSYCHTNHCFDGDVAARSKVPPASTTHDRMAWLEADTARAPVHDLADAWARLGSEDGWPRSICTNMATPESPHGAATCGAIAMNLTTGEVWAQSGFIHNVAPEPGTVSTKTT
ncbi:MAG TPA: C45 family peptidase [Kofleriaceae bacterium]|jgi:isopenicillin-N N-acyltransferase-like protein|nr:C45 family peptidase [Kofleriaceae bacterium]